MSQLPHDPRAALVKFISSCIGTSGTFRPEGQAEAVVAGLEKEYELYFVKPPTEKKDDQPVQP